ncbi:MAG: hypothetical protein EXR72_25905 [Myxococcales bacterium]|nr:hypothetical protein [Myxococcales bacterium]
MRFIVREQTTATRQVVSALIALAPHASATPPTGPAVAGRPHAPTVALPVSTDAHLVLITVDALRPDHLGAWGSTRTIHGAPLTPAIDALAGRGVRFARTYAQAPHSAYSITSLLTSDYIASTTQLGLPPPPTLAELLAAHGFHTEAFFPLGLFFNGRQELGSFAERRFGFARTTTWDLDARALTDEVLKRLDALRRQGEPRTFLWVHYFDAHEPYLRHPELDLGASAVERYDSEIAFLDRELARLLAALARLDRPTVVALAADHGEEFKEHGGWYHGSSLYEEQVRVPLIVVAPGLAARVVERPVELCDLAPTLLALLGEPPAPSQRGDNLGAALLGVAEPDRPVFSEIDGKRMVRRGDWKLIHDVRRDTSELYDLAADPRELRNLHDEKPALGAELGDELNGWIEGLRTAGESREPAALTLARLGDRRSVAGLAAILCDHGQPTPVRAEAARLAGVLEGYEARTALREVLSTGQGSPCDAVCAEAAIALGELTDRRALPSLVALLADPRWRRRAGVMLGRLRDPRATEALIETIADPDVDLRRKAIHYLGFVGDHRAIAPLAARLDDLRARYLVALALARIGAREHDPTVLPLLLDHLARETYEDNRAHFVCALGLLADRSAPRAPDAALAALRAALANPPVKWATETLVRLGAVDGRVASGVDFGPAIEERPEGLKSGFTGCLRRQGESTDDYAGATTCTLDAPVGRVRFEVSHPAESELVVRIAPSAEGLRLALGVNGRPLSPVALEPGWHEVRITTPATVWRRGQNDVTVAILGGSATGAQAELDHLLVLPRSGTRY